MKRLFNILLYLLLAIFASGLAVSGVVYFLLRASVPDYDEDFSVAGIEGPVDILRDAAAIPHISADSAADAYFALGFVHAQDRLGQLLRARRAAQALLPLDQTIEVEPSTAQALDAYAAGVYVVWRACKNSMARYNLRPYTNGLTHETKCRPSLGPINMHIASQ